MNFWDHHRARFLENDLWSKPMIFLGQSRRPLSHSTPSGTKVDDPWGTKADDPKGWKRTIPNIIFETFLGQNSTVLKYRSVSQSGRSYKKKDPKPWLNGSIFMSSFQKYCVIDDIILSHYDVTVKVTNIIIWLISALRNDDIMSKLSSDDDVTWFDMSHIIWVITWPV